MLVFPASRIRLRVEPLLGEVARQPAQALAELAHIFCRHGVCEARRRPFGRSQRVVDPDALGSYEQAGLTADRTRTWAEVSGSPLASAAAVRELAIVLRHQDRDEEAQCLMTAAAARVEATGLRTEASTSAYAQMLCTLAYTAVAPRPWR